MSTGESENPGGDLSTELITVRDEGERLSGEELIHTLLLVIGAGFETTVNLIGNAVHALLRHPDQLKQVLAGPGGPGDAALGPVDRRRAVALRGFRHHDGRRYADPCRGGPPDDHRRGGPRPRALRPRRPPARRGQERGRASRPGHRRAPLRRRPAGPRGGAHRAARPAGPATPSA